VEDWLVRQFAILGGIPIQNWMLVALAIIGLAIFHFLVDEVRSHCLDCYDGNGARLLHRYD
jgi:hypothetical protein